MNFENQEKNYFFVIKFFLQMRILNLLLHSSKKLNSKFKNLRIHYANYLT